ncbi:MAG TPA: hypothetical protein PLP33_24620 [Leptospiraceae bacterium]|nr:hypothetical protein [Leptospiraceae bacterium]
MITILNTSILTSHGNFTFLPATLPEEVKEKIKDGFQSAIGH